MASIITATTTSGLTQSADNSGVLQLASGTGNLVTIPSVTGTAMVSGNMPTFSYYQSNAQTLSSNVATKLTFTSSEWDTTSGMFASSRFTPTVAGYYQINAAFAVGATATNGAASVYKNGSEFKRGVNIQASSAIQTVNVLVYCNGSTDYIEIYGTVALGQATSATQAFTYFQGNLVRAA